MYKINLDKKDYNELLHAYYEMIVLQDIITNARKETVNPKWDNYLEESVDNFNKNYQVILNKVVQKNAPCENYTYHVDIFRGIINYNEC